MQPPGPHDPHAGQDPQRAWIRSGGSGERQPPWPGSALEPAAVESSSSGERLVGSARSGPPQPRHLEGRRFGPYLVRGLIAHGGMGSVYEAEHTTLQRRVALKVMLPGGETNPEDVQRFLREAQAASRLSHPNLVPIYDVGELQGVHYLAMELVRGDTIHTLIKRQGHLEEGQALGLVYGAAQGLAHAHRNGVLHRDLKPANVIVQPDGTPRLTDFGVAKTTGSQRLTATGIALGTPSYMSPEQAMGLNTELDARSDVYGLGAILYECLTGQPPFNEGSHVATMQAVVSAPPKPVRTLRAEISPDVEAICLKCLHKDKEERYASCEELMADIRACLQGRTIQARLPGLWLRAYRRVRRNSVIVALGTLALGATLALGLAAPALMSNRRQERLEPRLRAALEARLGQLEQRLGPSGAAPGGALLEEVAGGLAPEALLAAATEGLGARTEEAEPLAREALAQLRPARDALLGRIELERARSEADPGRRLERYAAAVALLGPGCGDGRLALARALVEHGGQVARDLGRRELEALALAPGSEPWREQARAALVPLWTREGQPEQALAQRASVPAEQLPLLELLARRAALPGSRWALVHGRRELLALDPRGDLVLWGAEGEQARASGARATAGSPLVGWGLPQRALGFYFTGAGPNQRLTLAEHRDGALALKGAKIVMSGQLAVMTAGSLGGEGVVDLLLVPRDYSGRSVVYRLDLANNTSQQLSFPTDMQEERYATSSAAFVDLDGDGKDELLLGSTEFGPARLRVLTPSSDRSANASLTAGSSLPMPPLDRLCAGPRLAGARGACVVCVVDRAPGERFTPDAERAWLGQDGVYLVADRGQGPELVGRWTWGGDEAPDDADAARSEGILAAPLQRGGRSWLARVARVDGEALLEIAPLEALGLEPAADLSPLVLGLPELPASLAAADLDGDGEDELLLGSAVYGLGEAAVARPDPPAEPSAAALQVRLAQALHLLDRPEAAEALARQAEERWPRSLEAIAAALAGPDAALTQAEDQRQRALRAFARGASEEGRQAWSAWEVGARAAAAACEARPLGGASWGRAAAIWRRLGEAERAEQAFARALEAPELPFDQRERLERDRAEVRRAGSGVTLALPLGAPAKGDSPWRVVSPWRVGFADGAVSVRCAPDSTVQVGLPLTSGAGPWRLRGKLRLGGNCWVARAEVGLLDLAGGGLTGLSIALWDNSTLAPSVTAFVAGRPVGRRTRLSTFYDACAFQLDVRPRAGGGVDVTLRLEDPAGQLIHLTEGSLDASPGGRQLLGIRCPAREGREAALAQGTWAMDATVRLEQLELQAPGVALEESEGPERIEALLALQQAAAAVELSATEFFRAERPGDARLSLVLALALAEQGAQDEALAAAWSALSLDPLQAYHLLEDLADCQDRLSPATLRLLAALGRGLRASSNDALVQRFHAALFRGQPQRLGLEEVDAELDPLRRALAAYLGLLGDPQAWTGPLLERYQQLRPGGRLPRTYPVRFLVAVPPEEREREAAELTRQLTQRGGGGSLTEARRLQMLRPDDLNTRKVVAEQYARDGCYGLAEALLARALDQELPPAQRGQLWGWLASLRWSCRRSGEALRALEEQLPLTPDPAVLLSEWEASLGREPGFQALRQRYPR